jgi:hypothetical protein
MTKRLNGLPNLPFAPFVGALFGVVAAILILNTPSWMLEKLVNGIGLAAILPAAAPPLGDTARTLLAVITGVLVALPLWLVLRVIEGEVHKSRVAKARGSNINPAEAAPQEGRRRSPIRAGAELGAPLMSDEALSNGGELLLSEPAAVEASAFNEPARVVQEETLLDLDSWNHEPATAAEVPFDLTGHGEQAFAEAPQALPPVSWDQPESFNSWDAAEPVAAITEEPIAEAPAATLPWETTSAFEVAPPVTGKLDPFNLSVSNLPSATEPAEARAESIPAPAPARFEPVTFEIVPVEQLTGIEPAPIFPAARPTDILDSAAFLTPDLLGDDFRDPAADVARGLSTEGFVSFDAPAEAVAAPVWPAPEQVDSNEEPEPASPVSFETTPAWQDEAPFETAPSAFETAAVSVPMAPSVDAARDEDDASLLGLLDRLEAALARRATQSAPPAPTNLAALREILSQSQSAGDSPRAAGRNW